MYLYELDKKKDKRRDDADFIIKSVEEIDKNLEALGFMVRVTEVNILEDFYEYYLEVAIGTDLHKLEKHDRELALALASPTGKVHWKIPVPGTNYIGLRVPKPSNKYLGRIKNEENERLKKRDLRSKIAYMFFIIGQVNYSIAQKILGMK